MSGYEIMVDAAALPDQHVRKEFGRLARSRRRLRFADATSMTHPNLISRRRFVQTTGSLASTTRDSAVAYYGAIVSAFAILALFFGQRIAKEYAGAAILVPYFLLTLVAIYRHF